VAKATCNVDECGGAVSARGMCVKHWTRWRRHGDPLLTKHTNRIVKNGYVLIKAPSHPIANSQGYVPEHRMVAHDAGLDVVGKHVHHIDRNKQNNDLSNLEVLDLSEHAAKHGSESNSGQFVEKEFCKRGHPLAGDNLYIKPSNGKRECRECWKSRYYEKNHSC
jgi:HNH endonuclease